MGFIKDAIKFNVGTTMVNYFDSAMNSVTQVATNKATLVNQIASMKSNPDFTQEDWKEVEELLNKLNTAIDGLN